MQMTYFKNATLGVQLSVICVIGARRELINACVNPALNYYYCCCCFCCTALRLYVMTVLVWHARLSFTLFMLLVLMGLLCDYRTDPASSSHVYQPQKKPHAQTTENVNNQNSLEVSTVIHMRKAGQLVVINYLRHRAHVH